MPDRLNELLRQRALLQEHLAWLDREIAAEVARSGAAAPAPPTPAAAPSSPVAPAAPPQWQAPPSRPAPASTGSRFPSGERDPDAILERYREEARDVTQSVRSGCFLYFALAFLLLGAAIVALYFHTFRKH